jgi:hypothetical protein
MESQKVCNNTGCPVDFYILSVETGRKESTYLPLFREDNRSSGNQSNDTDDD